VTRSFLGSTSDHPLPYYGPNTAPKGMQIGIFQPNYQKRKIAISRSHQTL